MKKNKRCFCSAVIVAAGSSARFGEDKLLVQLRGKSVLHRTLIVFEECENIDEIILVVRKDRLEELAEICAGMRLTKLHKMVAGGSTRTQSALAGAVETDRKAKIILIHDAARPLVTCDLIEETIDCAAVYRSAAPAVRVKDTIKRAENGAVIETPPRDSLFAVQTPQAFDADIIKGALTNAVQKSISCSDDCAAAEALGLRTHLTAGSEENIKITTPLDIELAGIILDKRRETQ